MSKGEEKPGLEPGKSGFWVERFAEIGKKGLKLYDKDGHVFIHTPDLPQGHLLGMESIDRLEELKGESRLNTSVLKKGDVIAFTAGNKDEPANYVFEITDDAMHDFYATYGWGPNKSIIGRISGADVPHEAAEHEVIFHGSGWGGSITEGGLISTNRTLCFMYGERCLFYTPTISYYEVFRPDTEGYLHEVPLNLLMKREKSDNEQHQSRLDIAQQILILLGHEEFDFRDGRSDYDFNGADFSTSKIFEDQRLIVEARACKATANTVAVYDKQNGLWLELKYYNFRGDDVLQLAYANVSLGEIAKADDWGFGPLPFRPTRENSIYRTGTAVVTHTTSIKSNLDVISYVSSEEESTALGMPLWKDKDYPVQAHFIIQNGSVDISSDEFLDGAMSKVPDIKEKIMPQVALKAGNVLILQGKEIKIPNHDDSLNEILEYLKQQATKSQKASV